MKNFLGKIVGMETKKKVFYFSAFLLICFLVALPSSSAHAIDLFGDSITEGITGWVATFVFQVLMIVLKFASLLVYFSAWLVDMMLDPAMYRSILVGLPDATTGKPTGAVLLGWQTIRDFCNMFYVFFLLLIAFSTIVGNQTYSAKSLLPKFIISLFLINFSAEITKMVIDVGQVFLFGMASWLGTFSGAQGSGAALTGIVNYFEQSLGSLDNPSSEDIITVIFAVLYTFALAAVYAALAGFLLFRLVMFAALIIISPFAFFSMVLPSMGKYTNQWRSLLVSNAISGPVLLFFVYISAMMAKNLVDHPIAVTAGDTSKMSFLSNILIRIVPHMVALGMLLFGIKAATSVGAAGSSYVAGGNFYGAGKMMGLGYAGFKLGERATRRGAGWAKDASVRNFRGAAKASDIVHGAYQKGVGIAGSVIPLAGGTATNMVMKDQALQTAAKKRMYDERLKQAGGDLKAVDVDLALKGDNISKAIGLMAAAEQNKLGDLDKDGNSKYASSFREASSIMGQGQIKDLGNKNLAFAPLLSENRGKNYASLVAENKDGAKDRMEAAVDMGYSKDQAVKQELMLQKAKGVVGKGKGDEVQGLDQAEVASAMVIAYKDKTGSFESLKKLSDDKKGNLRQGLEKQTNNLQDKYNTTTSVNGKNGAKNMKLELATAAIKSGSLVDNALSKKNTEWNDFDAQANKVFEEELSLADVSSLRSADWKPHAHRIKAEHIKELHGKKNAAAIKSIKDSMANADADHRTVQDRAAKETAITVGMN